MLRSEPSVLLYGSTREGKRESMAHYRRTAKIARFNRAQARIAKRIIAILWDTECVPCEEGPCMSCTIDQLKTYYCWYLKSNTDQRRPVTFGRTLARKLGLEF